MCRPIDLHCRHTDGSEVCVIPFPVIAIIVTDADTLKQALLGQTSGHRDAVYHVTYKLIKKNSAPF